MPCCRPDIRTIRGAGLPRPIPSINGIWTSPWRSTKTVSPTPAISLLSLSAVLICPQISREELSGTYGINATPGYERIPNQNYSIVISFGSSPDRTDALVKRVFDEIEAFKTNGPTDQQLADERETLMREFETQSKTNVY